MISADEKTSSRTLPLPPIPAGRRIPTAGQHDYTRGGALAYLAAYDVHRAIVTAAGHHRHRRVHRLVDQVMSQQPYKSARRVFWIVDNGSSYAGRPPSIGSQRYPNAIMVHTPVHASWLNQVEIFFSIIQRKGSAQTSSAISASSSSG